MGSLPKCEDEVKFVITGFSRFHGVAENPTEEIAKTLPDYWKKSCEKDKDCLYECSTLKVSADACDVYLAKTAELVAQELMDKTVVWIHLGVDPGAKEISLESQAVNNASFLSPDEDGCQFMYQYIDAAVAYDESIASKLNIDGVLERLSQSKVHLKKSFDAGRFICNWIYFRSLRQAQLLNQPKWHSLFVHVPQFHHISKEKQLHDIAALIQAIREEVVTGSVTSRLSTPAIV